MEKKLSSALQNRLVGTIIIVALVVIFLPDLLDGEKQTNNQTFADVPANPLKQQKIETTPFPTQEVIDATRRPVEIISESEVTDSRLNAPQADADDASAVDVNSSQANSSQANSTQSQLAENAEQQTAPSTQQNVGVSEADSLSTKPAQQVNSQLTQADASLAQQTVVNTSATADIDAGWVVQLGSFRYQKNVNELLDKLDAAGYRAFSRRVDTSAGRLNKVFVGPELDKSKLDSALPHLNEVTGLKGKVAAFAEATN